MSFFSHLIAQSSRKSTSVRALGAFAALAAVISITSLQAGDAAAQSSKRMVTAEKIFKQLSGKPSAAAARSGKQTRNRAIRRGVRVKRGQRVRRGVRHAHRSDRGRRHVQRPRHGKLSVGQLKRDHRVRSSLPSIDIQAINFAFGSARIPHSQRWKVEAIANAMLRFGRYERFLIEGHTDAVGSYGSNLDLSERRAQSLKYALVDWFGVPARSLVTVGYGEEYLLIPSQWEEWRNRRVTLRRATAVLR
ncbi:MAG: OmpA family protein [Pseudomonadota bacterium]